MLLKTIVSAPQCAVAFSWLGRLSFLSIRRAMSAGTCVPGRVTQAEQAEGEETDEEHTVVRMGR